MQCKIGGVPSGSTDLQIHVIQALSDDDAFSKAMFLGRKVETSYPTADGETVTWEFQGLHELDTVNAEALGDGTEIWNQMSQQLPSTFVKEKATLAVFWLEANKDRKASDILRDRDA